MKIQIWIAAKRCQVKWVATYSGIALRVPPAKRYSTSFSRNPHQENDRPIDDSLKEDRLDHGSRVKTAQEWHCIRHQHRLSHNQGCYGCDHEARKANEVISENEVSGHDDEIEANCEEYRWRYDFPELFD